MNQDRIPYIFNQIAKFFTAILVINCLFIVGAVSALISYELLDRIHLIDSGKHQILLRPLANQLFSGVDPLLYPHPILLPFLIAMCGGIIGVLIYLAITLERKAHKFWH